MDANTLLFIKESGGSRACVKYLEYLSLDFMCEDALIHNELGHIYAMILQSQAPKIEGSDEIDKEMADQSETLF